MANDSIGFPGGSKRSRKQQFELACGALALLLLPIAVVALVSSWTRCEVCGLYRWENDTHSGMRREYLLLKRDRTFRHEAKDQRAEGMFLGTWEKKGDTIVVKFGSGSWGGPRTLLPADDIRNTLTRTGTGTMVDPDGNVWIRIGTEDASSITIPVSSL